MHSKTRRQNNGMNGGGNNQHRHHNNRQRRFNNGGRQGEDSGNVARVRRHAQQQREKYQNMARDAMSSGDRVLAENYLQHADHYHRVILSLPPEEQPRQHHQPRQTAGEPAAEGDASHESQSGEGEEVASMPSADALPSFITQQPMASHPAADGFEE